MYEHDVLESEDTAQILLASANPRFERDFHLVCNAMKIYLEKVRDYFPDARYHLKEGGFNLMLGDPMSNDGEPQQKLIAAEDIAGVYVDGDGL